VKQGENGKSLGLVMKMIFFYDNDNFNFLLDQFLTYHSNYHSIVYFNFF